MMPENAPDGPETIFDRYAAHYDAWYVGRLGRVAFPQEVDALRPLLAGLPKPWLEVGVGTGRFAQALGMRYGVDPSMSALVYARERGLLVAAGQGEALPFGEGAFGAVVLVVTLCFVNDPLATVREARRVLRSDGGVILGLVLAESPWGHHYQQLAARGHPYYRLARFFTHVQITTLLAHAGLEVVRERSALFQSPTDPLLVEPARDEADPNAGFRGILARIQS
jgi:SAM-dependent methyltransferase